jgi:hypothetical protein
MNTNPDLNQETLENFSEGSSVNTPEPEKLPLNPTCSSPEFLPPPIPLIPKTLRPSEPFFQSQKIPYETLEDFSLQEQLEPIGAKFDVKLSELERYGPGVSLKSLFPKEKLVYLRWSHLHKTDFNSNKCDLKKLLNKRKNREKEDRNYQNHFLVDKLERFYKAEEGDLTLVFESRFESGNLAMASKLSDWEYDLILQSDINSKGHTQWFFFSVENTRKSLKVKFNILNFAKSDSLYNDGMKVLMYSKCAQDCSGRGWFRGGEDISYYNNGIVKECSSSLKTYSSLSFTYIFEYSQDRVYFAYSLPYTYSSLQSLLDSYENDKVRSQFFHRKTLCKSLGGNSCDYLTISNKGTLDDIKNKRVVIISSRVHPGETVGSWMMLGVLDFLTSLDPEAQDLRSKYIFKVIPMLNPDGVINGNYRCSLVGADLNRRWKNPQVDLHPIIHNLKKLIKNTAENYEIDLICDLHGHSRKQNIFMYGCDFPKSPETCRLFPYILSKISPVFSFEDSRFGVQKAKESTLRVALFKDLKIPNIFTLEASFCGSNFGKYKGFHYTGGILADMGRDLCKSLLILSQNSKLARNPALKKPSLVKVLKKKTEEEMSLLTSEHNLESLLKELLQKKDLLNENDGNFSSSGSESEPSEDNLDQDTLKILIPQSAGLKRETFCKKRLDRSMCLPRHKSVKKCEKCGGEETTGHNCKFNNFSCSSRRKIVGLRTYYNICGKKVHDQATQTPPSFYEKSPKKRYMSSLDPLPLDSTLSIYEEIDSQSRARFLPGLQTTRQSSRMDSKFSESPKKLQPLNLSKY